MYKYSLHGFVKNKQAYRLPQLGKIFITILSRAWRYLLCMPEPAKANPSMQVVSEL